MARGDFVDITYRIPTGVSVHRMQSMTVGGGVEVRDPSKQDPFFIVAVTDRNGDSIERARFAASEVVAIIEGHQTILKRLKPVKVSSK